MTRTHPQMSDTYITGECYLTSSLQGSRIPLPELPPVLHMELGRQEPFGGLDRRRDPFDGVTSNALVGQLAEIVTIEEIAALLLSLEPLPPLPPFHDPDYELKVDHWPPNTSGIAIYWTDSQGRLRGPTLGKR